MVAGTYSCPARQVNRSWRRCHIKPDLGNKGPGSNLLYSGHCDPTSDSIGEFLVLFSEVLQTMVERLDLGTEKAKLTKQAIEQEAMMVADATLQCQLQFRDLTSQFAEREVG
jgi:hypothetical protein